MKRKLLAQMRNEWRSNLWMVIELVIVLFVLQGVFTVLYFIYDLHTPAEGYDLNDVYMADIKTIDTDSPEYIPYDSVHSYFTDRDMLIARLKENPCVEEVGIGDNALPYNYNYYGIQIQPLDSREDQAYGANVRTMSPGVVRAIRLTGLHGETTEQLAAILERGDMIVSGLAEGNDWTLDPEKIRGKRVFWNGDSSQTMTVGAVAHGIPRSDFEPLRAGVAYFPVEPGHRYYQMVIRVKPGMGHAFTEGLSTADKQQGNVLITDIRSVDYMREAAHVDVMSTVRSTVVAAVFLLVVIFLGFLGTFWFRTQQRVGEIAVRKISGATDRDIFARLIGEGLILLAVSALIAVPTYIWLAMSGAVSEAIDVDVSQPVAGSAIALVSVTALIVAGIWLPARKATKVDPAMALKDL